MNDLDREFFEAFIDWEYERAVHVSGLPSGAIVLSAPLHPLLMIACLPVFGPEKATKLGEVLRRLCVQGAWERSVFDLLLHNPTFKAQAFAEPDQARLKFYVANIQFVFRQSPQVQLGWQILQEIRPLLIESREKEWTLLQLARLSPQIEPIAVDAAPENEAAMADLVRLASYHQQRGDIAKSRQLADIAMAYVGRHKGTDSEVMLWMVNSLGALQRAYGDKEKALEMARKAVQIGAVILPANHPDRATDLQNLGVMLLTMRQHRESVEYLQQAFQIRSSSGSVTHEAVLRTAEALLTARCMNSEWDMARDIFAEMLRRIHVPSQRYLPMLEAAIEASWSRDRGSHVSFTQLLLALGQLCAERSQLAEACLLLEAALAWMTQAFGPRSLAVASVLSSLGTICVGLQDFLKAELYARRGAVMLEELGAPAENRRAAEIILGKALSGLGRHEEALSLAEGVVSFRRAEFGENDYRFLGALNAYACICISAGQWEHAERAFHEALKLSRDGSPHMAENLAGLGELLRRARRFGEAESYLSRALGLDREIYGARHLHVRTSLLNVGLLRAELGRHQEAVGLILEALSIQWDRSREDLLLLPEEARGGWLGTWYQMHLPALSLMPWATTEELETFYLLHVKARGATLWADRLVARSIHQSREPSLVEASARLKALRQPLCRALFDFALDSMQTGTQMSERLSYLMRESHELKSRLIANANIRECDCDIQGALPDIFGAMSPGTCLVEYFRFQRFDFTKAAELSEQYGEDAYLAIVISESGKQIRSYDLGLAGEIDELVWDFRDKLTQHATIEDVRSAGIKLSARLLGQFRESISDKTTLVIVPDGDITLVPFETLPDGDEYLIDKFEIVYAFGAADLLRASPRVDGTSSPPLIVSGFDFDHPIPRKLGEEILHRISDTKLPGFRFGSLPGADAEAKLIKNHFPDAVLLYGPNVTREHIEAHRAPRFVHFATHGYYFGPVSTRQENLGDGETDLLSSFDANSFPMLRSGLVISGVNPWLETLSGDLDSGLYSAEEMLNLDLHGTDFVVLSACTTGIGQRTPGQGVQGLRRAMRIAGANVLITALWEVDDQMTKLLMENFYQWLAKSPTSSCQKALREAQLKIKKMNGHPHAWGGFICDGIWERAPAPCYDTKVG